MKEHKLPLIYFTRQIPPIRICLLNQRYLKRTTTFLQPLFSIIGTLYGIEAVKVNELNAVVFCSKTIGVKFGSVLVYTS